MNENIDTNTNAVEEQQNQNELDAFRQSWKREVEQKRKQKTFQKTAAPEKDQSSSHEESKSARALKLFQQGIDNERSKQLHSAVQCYRMAIQLDPDVEQHMFNSQIDADSVEFVDMDSDNSADITSGLLHKFNCLTLDQQHNKHLVESYSNEANFTQLPNEVLRTILRWVASTHTDMKSIENLSMTCRKLYVLSRDPLLWKAACEKVGLVRKMQKLSWRQMFIGCLYPRVDGVYISKVSYFRQGDPSVMSIYYTPFQCVEYYRYVRFFSNGQMVMHTTAEEPDLVVSKLTQENIPSLNCRVGRYTMHGQHYILDVARISAILTEVKPGNSPRYQSSKRARQREEKYIVTNTEYFLELELSSTSRKRSNKLSWINYSCQCQFGKSGRTSNTEISLGDHFPPFYFSIVKSYGKCAFASL